MDESSLFTATKYATSPDIDTDFRTVVPTLKTLNEDGSVATTAVSNEEKATLLASVFFPKAPQNIDLNRNPCRNPLPDPPPFTEERIIKKLKSLSPYKAPGSDGIPNVVLGKCADILAPHLVYIFNSFDELKAFVEAWLYSDTGVLRKPGKASYFFAKCFRPIALIMTLAKAYTSLLADDISHVAECLGLIPPTQFGGRPGRMTTDGIHLAIDHIMNAWRNKRDAAMLSLDIEGAFPNAVMQRVLYNMRKRRVPEKLVQAISRVLIGRKTRIRFGDFTSEYMELTNGIGQGDLLSMIVYLFYNADFFDIRLPNPRKGISVGFVDDKNVIVDGGTAEKNVELLKEFMEKPGGANEHNSKFELSKMILIHFPRPRSNKTTSPPPLQLHGTTVMEKSSVRMLGVMMDSNLNWKEQFAYAHTKASGVVSALWKLSRPSSGIPMKMMRRLYISVVIPKMTYGLDTWYTPPHIQPGGKKRRGSVKALKAFEQMQRKALLTISGALRSSPTDVLETLCSLLPMELLLKKICHRALMRINTLPSSHPLNTVAKNAY